VKFQQPVDCTSRCSKLNNWIFAKLFLRRRPTSFGTILNPLECKSNYSPTSTGCWWIACYIWYCEEGTGRGSSPLSPLLPYQSNSLSINGQCTNHCIAVRDNSPLLWGFSVLVKGLNCRNTDAFGRHSECTETWHLHKQLNLQVQLNCCQWKNKIYYKNNEAVAQDSRF